MQNLKIDPSIASSIDIGPVLFEEDLNIYFTANEALSGVFEAKYYTNSEKNTVKQIVGNPLTMVGNVLTFKVAPSIQALGNSDCYYEIWHSTTKRLFFKGTIKIVK